MPFQINLESVALDLNAAQSLFALIVFSLFSVSSSARFFLLLFFTPENVKMQVCCEPLKNALLLRI